MVAGRLNVMLVARVSCHCMMSLPPSEVPAETSNRSGCAELKTSSQVMSNFWSDPLQIIDNCLESWKLEIRKFDKFEFTKNIMVHLIGRQIQCNNYDSMSNIICYGQGPIDYSFMIT